MSVLLLSVTACQVQIGEDQADGDKDSDQAEKVEERVPVEVLAVTRGPIEAVLQSTTNLEAEAAVTVFARTANPVVDLRVEEGDRVEKDDILVVLENESQTITLRKAKARLERAEREFQRKQELHARDLITDQEFNEADYELSQARLEVDEAQLQLAFTEIRAPIAGTITQRMVNLGDQVNVNQQVFDMVNFDSIVARIYIPEKNLGRLSLGQEARITTQALPGQVFRGRVGRIAPTVDAKTGTVKVTVMFDRIGPLRPGMYVNVALVLDTHDQALLIPKRALVYDADQLFVFRLEADNTVERVLVQPALTDEENVEPVTGFAAGDLVVVAGQTGLKNGAEVRVLDAAGPEEGEQSSPVDNTDEDDDATNSEAVETASTGKVSGQ